MCVFLKVGIVFKCSVINIHRMSGKIKFLERPEKARGKKAALHQIVEGFILVYRGRAREEGSRSFLLRHLEECCFYLLWGLQESLVRGTVIKAYLKYHAGKVLLYNKPQNDMYFKMSTVFYLPHDSVGWQLSSAFSWIVLVLAGFLYSFVATQKSVTALLHLDDSWLDEGDD